MSCSYSMSLCSEEKMDQWVGDLKPGFGGGMEIRVKGIKLNKEG